MPLDNKINTVNWFHRIAAYKLTIECNETLFRLVSGDILYTEILSYVLWQRIKGIGVCSLFLFIPSILPFLLRINNAVYFIIIIWHKWPIQVINCSGSSLNIQGQINLQLHLSKQSPSIFHEVVIVELVVNLQYYEQITIV